MSELSKRLAKEIHELEVAVDQKKADWDAQRKKCANPECGKDLRRVNPTFGINNSQDEYCSRRCRATKTGERWESDAQEVAQAPDKPQEKSQKAGKSASAAKPVAQEKAGKKAASSGGSQPEKPAAPKRTGSAPWSKLDGKLKLGKAPNLQGNRAKILSLIKNGMTVADLYKACEKEGIDGKGTLSKVMTLYPDAVTVE